jgi:hypothetical protein
LSYTRKSLSLHYLTCISYVRKVTTFATRSIGRFVKCLRLRIGHQRTPTCVAVSGKFARIRRKTSCFENSLSSLLTPASGQLVFPVHGVDKTLGADRLHQAGIDIVVGIAAGVALGDLGDDVFGAGAADFDIDRR